jgi:hypothetical protein
VIACPGCGRKFRFLPDADLCKTCQARWVSAGCPDELPAAPGLQPYEKPSRKLRVTRSRPNAVPGALPFRPYVWRDPKRTGKAR